MKKLLALVLLATPAFAQVGPAVSVSTTLVNGAPATSTGCTATSLVYINSSGNLSCGASPAPTYSSFGFINANTSAFTASTMTATNVVELRTVTSAYAWTNAMLVALGASLTGDVNVAVLPAKTQVLAAYVVIDTPGTDANTLTVSCGDGAAPASNYVKAGDAKAAANTVYGDSITGSETGTNLFSTFFITNYVPSYTATTTVSCRFTKTVANLSTQTGSTGRVILVTTQLP